jgi:hypothetical protein
MTPSSSSCRRPRPARLVLPMLAALAAPLCACDGTIDTPAGLELDENASALVAPNTVLVDASFATSAEGFSYFDDTFRGTSKPAYAAGAFVTTGFTSGAVRVRLGGVDNTTVTNMSGGWGRSFSLSEPARVTVTFRYNLTQSPNYEVDESS